MYLYLIRYSRNAHQLHVSMYVHVYKYVDYVQAD